MTVTWADRGTIIGPPGPTGPPGATGPTGPAGPDGGTTPHAARHAVGGSDVLTPAAIGALPRLTPTAVKTAAYTAATGEMVVADTTGGAFTITLPPAVSGAVVGVKKSITASATLTVARSGADTIGAAGGTSITVRLPDETVILVANGSNWVIFANYMPLPSLDGRYIRSDGASNAAGGALAGFYPNPTIAPGAVGSAEVATALKDPTAGTAGLRTLGTGAAQAAAGDDARILGAAQKAANLSDLVSPSAARVSIAAATRLVPTSTKTANYTAADGEYVKVDATAGPVTITVPTASTGAMIGVKKGDTSANAVTVTDGGSLSFDLRTNDEARIIVGQGTGWTAQHGLMSLSSLDSRYMLRSAYQAKGDLLVGTGAGTFGRATLSANEGYVLTVDSSTGTGVRWAAPSGGGGAPAAHAASHAVGGSDVLTPAAIGAARDLVPTATKTAAYTAAVGELVMVDATAGPVTVTLPTLAAGARVGVKKIDASANQVTIAAAAGQTVGGQAAASTTVSTQYQIAQLQYNSATNWAIVGGQLALPSLDARYVGAALLDAPSGIPVLTGTVLPRKYQQYATTTLDGTVVLTNDLGGTGQLPTVPGLPKRLVTAKGDMIVATGAGAVAVLPIGATGQRALVDPTAATGVKWGYSPVRTVTAATTLTQADEVVIGNTTAGGFTVTLPSAVGIAGETFTVKKIGTANALTIASAGGTIDGAATELIWISGGFRTLVSDGTNWQIVGGRIEPIILSLASVGAGGNIAIDSAVASIYRVTTTGATANLPVPTNPLDGGQINVEILANVALTLTVNASILLTSGLTASISVPVGKRLFLGLRYVGTAWYLLAATVQS